MVIRSWTIQHTINEIKQTTRQIIIYKALYRKLQIAQHEPHKKLAVNSGAPEGKRFPFPSDICRVTLIINRMASHTRGKNRMRLCLPQVEHISFLLLLNEADVQFFAPYNLWLLVNRCYND
jgi:hypothetical protein